MSRIRTIKPDLWCSEQIISCSHSARLLFIGLLNFSDDNGVHPASTIRLKAQVFPSDACTNDEVKGWVAELIDNGLLEEYVIESKSYWIVTGWKNHQRIDKPTYKYPLPPPKREEKKLAEVQENSTSTPRAFKDCSTSSPIVLDEHSTTTQRALQEASATEWKGMEGNGKEKDICEVFTSPLCVIETKKIADTHFDCSKTKDVQAIFSYWQHVMNHPNAKLDKKRRTKIETALKNYSVDDLKKAIDGCANTPFNMGSNDRFQKYDGIDLIFRDAEHIESFITKAIGNAHTLTFANNPIFAGVI